MTPIVLLEYTCGCISWGKKVVFPNSGNFWIEIWIEQCLLLVCSCGRGIFVWSSLYWRFSVYGPEIVLFACPGVQSIYSVSLVCSLFVCAFLSVSECLQQTQSCQAGLIPCSSRVSYTLWAVTPTCLTIGDLKIDGREGAFLY